VLPESKFFFKRLRARMRQLRKERGWTVEDMQVRGIAAKHWQQIETGRSISVTTLLRVCQALDVTLAALAKDLDADIYKELPVPLPRKRKKYTRRRRSNGRESE
jgi:transcriptional regulator with XRE-family HTH domain